MRNLQSGDYLQKLYLSQQMNRRDDPNPCSSIACTYLNHSARKKKRQCRFEGHLHYNGSPITNLRELLYAINAYKLLPKQVKLNCDIAEFDLKDIRIYRSAGSTLAMINADEMLDRRLVALGILLEEGLVEIFGLGYMHSGLIYT